MVSIAKIDRISIMADAAEAITNGIEESGIIIIIRGMCWFHCKKSVDKQHRQHRLFSPQIIQHYHIIWIILAIFVMIMF
jgi:hypothetical protein